MPGVSKMGIKKKNRQELRTLKWDWLKALYPSQEKTNKKNETTFP